MTHNFRVEYVIKTYHPIIESITVKKNAADLSSSLKCVLHCGFDKAVVVKLAEKPVVTACDDGYMAFSWG
jgi:hypothetical protein